MRRYGCTKRNPNPKWPYEQAVVAVPPNSQAATAAKMNNSLRVLENQQIKETENLSDNNGYFRETNMPIMGYMQKDGIENSFGKIQSSVCSKIDTEAYLCQKVGSYLRVEFLFGENIHVEKTGVLKNVGKDFLVLTESGTDTEIVCSAKNIKFINIYNINKG